MAPGLERPIPKVVISREDYKRSKGEPTYLVGVVTYDDIFQAKPPHHITKFCYQIGQVGWSTYGGPFGIGSILNALDNVLPDIPWFKPSFDPCPYWNCADETCEPDRSDYHKDLDAAFEKAAKDADPDQSKKPVRHP
ncbi:MAG: hypothetical protein JWP25_1540 [Bradyrhizobium sp.]|nr:hypothetical protein [Bradyrhizobium sp.]